MKNDGRARRANAPAAWDALWANSKTADWREHALAAVYKRIVQLCPKDVQVVDVGGGRGDLARRLAAERGCRVFVLDSSPEAVGQAGQHDGVEAEVSDVEEWTDEDHPQVFADADVVVATEFLEHVSARAREVVVADCLDVAFFSVPNNRLGPDEEPQHTAKFTALEFLTFLRGHFYDDCRVEVLGGYLLGICGSIATKRCTLSATLPIRDEAHDLERTLASLRGIADELVVGIDPRTVDESRRIALAYADVVFDLVDPACQDSAHPDHDPAVPPEGVHFGHVRNQCSQRCAGDWIFMTEGHEHLVEGQELLLRLDKIGVDLDGTEHAPDVFRVTRSGAGQRWAYPWLYRNRPDIHWQRSTHNVLTWDGMHELAPEGGWQDGARPKTIVVGLPQVRTVHARHHANAKQRAGQRRVQNRVTLLDDWNLEGNAMSLFYLGQELRADGPATAIYRFKEFLALDKTRTTGAMRYQARLICAKLLCRDGQRGLARELLLGATADDWSRTEHWIWLGDLACEAENYKQALVFYRFAATTLGEMPFSGWWVDTAFYTYLPAMRLAMIHAARGDLKAALHWAQVGALNLPEDAPDEVVEEAESAVQQIMEALARSETPDRLAT